MRSLRAICAIARKSLVPIGISFLDWNSPSSCEASAARLVRPLRPISRRSGCQDRGAAAYPRPSFKSCRASPSYYAFTPRFLLACCYRAVLSHYPFHIGADQASFSQGWNEICKHQRRSEQSVILVSSDFSSDDFKTDVYRQTALRTLNEAVGR